MSGSETRPGWPIGSANADDRQAATTVPCGEGGTAAYWLKKSGNQNKFCGSEALQVEGDVPSIHSEVTIHQKPTAV